MVRVSGVKGSLCLVEELGRRASWMISLAVVSSAAIRKNLQGATFPREHWRQIWSNNPLEPLNRRSVDAPTSSGSSPTTLG